MDIISRKLANDRLYAYHEGRFWFWDETRNLWKESHLMSKKYDLNHDFDKLLSPEDFLSDPSQFCALEDYEVDSVMKSALRDAKPCQTVPIEPVEKQPNETVPVPTPQDKPAAPGFDYAGLSEQTVADLHLAEAEYQHGKKLAERGLVHMGDAIAMAHDALCGVVAQCDNLKHGNRGEDTFRAWCASIGVGKDTAYRLLQVSALLEDSSPRQQKVLESLPTTLLYAAAKPSAPAELVEQVKNGDITTNKEYKELLAQLKAEKDRANAAENRADTAEGSLTAALADVNGLTEQNAKLQQSYHDADESRIAANLQRQKAEAERDRAEARAKVAEEALKKQPITAVVDEEEVDRRAHQQAYGIAADMNEELRADRDRLQQDIAELNQRLAKAEAVVPADLVADRETADNCCINISGIWSMALPAFNRLIGTGGDLNDAASNLLELCDRIHADLVKMMIANDKVTQYE